MATTTLARFQTDFTPKVPQTIEELGIPQTLVVDLVLRRLLLEGISNLQTFMQTDKAAGDSGQ